MFYDPATHRLYYTVSGDSRLFYRYFSPESEIVGAQTFQADAGGVNFATVAGMTLASGRILYGSSTDGALRSAPFSGGRVTGAADGGQLGRDLALPGHRGAQHLSRALTGWASVRPPGFEGSDRPAVTVVCRAGGPSAAPTDHPYRPRVHLWPTSSPRSSGTSRT